MAGSGDIGDLLGVLDRLHRAGRPCPLIIVVSDPGLVAVIRRVSPRTTVVYRWVASDSDPSPFDEMGNGDGRAWVNELWHRHSQAPGAHFHQMFNEVTFHKNLDFWPLNRRLTYAGNVARVELDMMRRAEELGIKLTLGNYMPGVPEPETFGEVLRPMWDHASAHGHAALFHWYSDPVDDSRMVNGSSYMAERMYRYYAQWRGMPVLVGEMGLYNSPRFRGVDSIRATWKDALDVTRKYQESGQRIEIASWTIRGQNDIKWRHDDWTPHLAAYEQFMLEDHR